ncbi:Tripartite motif-containing protein 2 [Holothuria leucospilota]|uniref:Tripartite motif-containing protein 2 n=1 Tax=Holothuria leucospilota TaxID=206669 RepID=A0A9Q1BF75_HOLLE|nr:Tripartite motif-containing protein 2 [Holothuria leucospilota]
MTASLTCQITPKQRLQLQRFTEKQHTNQLVDLSFSCSGNIAVSGLKEPNQSFIDLFSGCHLPFRDKRKLFYSKEFQDYQDHFLRFVSFLENDGSKIVSCIGSKIEIFDMENRYGLVKACKVEGLTNCLAVTKGEIFVGLRSSQSLIVFNSNLKETRRIFLRGIKLLDFLCDLQVRIDTIFACTVFGRALSMGITDGRVITKYINNTENYSKAWSITVSVEQCLVAVLWSGYRIIFYSLDGNKCLLVFDVNSGVSRIRISDTYSMMITGNERTGEIETYEWEQLFSFQAMKNTLANIVSPRECEEIRMHFRVTEEELSRKEFGVKNTLHNLSEKEQTTRRMLCLLTVIEENGHLNSYNLHNLTEAVLNVNDETGIFNLKGPIEGYARHGISVEDLMADLLTRQKAWRAEKKEMSVKLETANSMVKKLNNMMKNVTCGICLEIWTSPKTLPCDHVFCEKCLEQVLIRNLQVVSCPECRQEHDHPPQGLQNSWFTNRCLKSIADDFRSLSTRHGQDS